MWPKAVPQVLIDANKKEKVYCGKYNALRGPSHLYFRFLSSCHALTKKPRYSHFKIKVPINSYITTQFSTFLL